MPQVLKTNIYSLNTQRQLDRSQSSLSTALERLASGYRINSAKDDAAGLAISERMSAQISGLDVARRNANDGVSLSQTAESAISTIGEMLRRMRDLAVQAANATNTDSDRVALNEEVVQLKIEIERIGTETNFNGRLLLDGSFTNQYFQIGADAGQVTVVNLTDSRASVMGAQFASETKTLAFSGSDAPKTTEEYSFDINGVRITVKQTAANGDYSDLKNAINRMSLQTNVKAEYRDLADPTSGLILSGASFDIGNFLGRDSNGAEIVSLPTISPQVSGTFPVGPINNIAEKTNGITAQTLSIYGSIGTEHIRIDEGATAKEVVDVVNTLEQVTGVSASARTVAYLAEVGGDGVLGFKLYGSNTSAIDISAEVMQGDMSNLARVINDVSDKTGITAEVSVDKTELKLVCEDGYDICIEDFSSSNPTDQTIVVRGPTSVGSYDENKVPQGPNDPAYSQIKLDGSKPEADSTRVGGRVYFSSEDSFRLETTEEPIPADPGGGSLLAANKVYPSTITIQDIDITTREGANTAIISIDAALTRINANRAKLGAVQSRFENAITNLQAVSENLSSARSRILDADYAAETANMASAQIIQQAGIAMLTQANALPQNVLSLLQSG